MVNAVFVAPFFAETTLRFVDAAADLPDVRLGLISQDDEQRGHTYRPPRVVLPEPRAGQQSSSDQ